MTEEQLLVQNTAEYLQNYLVSKPTRVELFEFWERLRKGRVEKRLLPYELAPLDLPKQF